MDPVAPDYAADLGRRLAAAGALPIDGPVSGGAAKAATGQLSMMAAGPDEAFRALGEHTGFARAPHVR